MKIIIETILQLLEDFFSLIKKIFQSFLIFLLIVFIASFATTAFGFLTQNSFLISIGCIIKAIISCLILIAISPLFNDSSSKKLLTFARTFFIYQLFFALLIIFIPEAINFKHFFAIFLGITIISLINSATTEMIVVKIATAVVIFLILTLTFFPSVTLKIFRTISKEGGEFSQAKLTKICPGDVSAGKIPFFLDGKPTQWFFLTPEGTYELFTDQGYHDLYQKKLFPVTPEIAHLLMKNENLLSARNLALCPKPSFFLKNPSVIPNIPDTQQSIPSPSNQQQVLPPTQPSTSMQSEPSMPTPPSSLSIQKPISPSNESSTSMQSEPDPSKQLPLKTKPYKYAVIFVNEKGVDENLSRQVSSWFGNDATSTISKEKGQQLAEYVLLINQSTMEVKNETEVKSCKAYLEAKIIDSQSGQVKETIKRTNQANAFSFARAQEIAIDMNLKSLKYLLEKK